MRLLPSFTWANITEVGDIQDFIRQPLYNYLLERDRYNLNEGSNLIMASKGVNDITGESVDEVARIMINFHNEVENLNPNTKEAFSNQT